jgi:hypothetical protein
LEKKIKNGHGSRNALIPALASCSLLSSIRVEEKEGEVNI